MLSASFQGVKRLFVLAHTIAANAVMRDNEKYFLSRGNIENYKVLIDGRNCYDQRINDLITWLSEICLTLLIALFWNFRLLFSDSNSIGMPTLTTLNISY